MGTNNSAMKTEPTILPQRPPDTQRKRRGAQVVNDQFCGLIEALPIGVVIFAENRLLYINKVASKALGCSAEQMPDIETFTKLFTPFYQPLVKRAMTLCSKKGKPSPFFEVEKAACGGTSLHLSIHFGNIDYQNQPAFLVTLLDITERKRSEKVQQAIYNISKTASSVEELDMLYHQIHQTLTELLPTHNCYIAVLDSSTNTIHFPFSVDTDVPTSGQLQYTPHKPYLGLANYILAVQKPLLITRQHYQNLVIRGELTQIEETPMEYIGIPLKTVEGNIVGVLAVQNFSKDFAYREEDKEILAFVSTQIAMAIERARAAQELARQAMYDQLTRLPNRNHIEQQLERAIVNSYQNSEMVGLFIFDLDRFRDINETLGHAIGDQILIEVAGRLKQVIGKTDFLGHWGGDDFVVIRTLQNLEEIQDISDRLMSAIAKSFQIITTEFFLDANIGYAIFPEDGIDADMLIKNASRALDTARFSLKNNIVRYEPSMQAETLERLHIVNRLRQSIDSQNFELHYQPQINLIDGSIIGLEALLRWKDPELGMLYPYEFIYLAEESGLIHPLGNWVFEQICRHINIWQRVYHRSFHISANISSIQFERSDLIDRILQLTEQYQIPGNRLAIEITESIFIHDFEEAVNRLKRLRNVGIRVDIDDFGTVYSSLTYLRKLPLDVIKIDKSFIDDLYHPAQDPAEAKALVKAIIDLGHGLNFHMMAEGVETIQQAKILRSLGCDSAQGYLFAKPMPEEQLEHGLQMIPSVWKDITQH